MDMNLRGTHRGSARAGAGTPPPLAGQEEESLDRGGGGGAQGGGTVVVDVDAQVGIRATARVRFACRAARFWPVRVKSILDSVDGCPASLQSKEFAPRIMVPHDGIEYMAGGTESYRLGDEPWSAPQEPEATPKTKSLTKGNPKPSRRGFVP